MLSFCNIRGTKYIFDVMALNRADGVCLGMLNYWKNCCLSNFLYLALTDPSLIFTTSPITTSHSRYNNRSYFLFPKISSPKPTVRWLVSSCCMFVCNLLFSSLASLPPFPLACQTFSTSSPTHKEEQNHVAVIVSEIAVYFKTQRNIV